MLENIIFKYENMLFVGLLTMFINEVLTGHLPNCTIKIINGTTYYDIPNFRFYQIHPSGFYIGFEGKKFNIHNF